MKMTIIFTLTCHVHVRQTLYGTLKQNFSFVKFHTFYRNRTGRQMYVMGGAKLDLMPSSNAGGVN